MATTELRDRLQPSLLDRLTDRAPHERLESEQDSVMTKAQLRQAVLRDLAWLFNATQPHPEWVGTLPPITGTVLNFGLPPLAGQRVSRLDVHELEATIAQAIRTFEPRILADTLTVRVLETSSVLDTHNTIEFEICGHLWAQPVPLEILLRTRLDLEAGQVEVRDAVAMAPLRQE